MQVVPVMVYFAASSFLTKENVGDLLPDFVISWLPMVLGALAFYISSQYSQKNASKATSKIVGEDAPDFEIDFGKEGKRMVQALIKESKLPTVVDFYQNFCPACGPAAQQIDKLAADPKYKGKVNFVLVNMKSLEDAETYAKQKGLAGAAKHGTGSPPADYGIMYIPHKVLIGSDGKVVKNFDLSLPSDLDALLADN